MTTSEGEVWLVIGGAGRGGIVVRTGAGLSSSELSRLETGSVVRALGREGERMRYKKVSGLGPEEGWISISSRGKPLLAPAPARQHSIAEPLPSPMLASVSDWGLALALVQRDWQRLESMPEKLRADRAFVLEAVKTCGLALVHAAGELKNDRLLVLAAVTQNGQAIKHASKALRADPGVIRAAASQSFSALRWVPAAALSDRGLALSLVEADPRCLQHLPGDMKGDREVVLSAVSRDGRCLEHAEARLCADREVVLLAVSQAPGALEHAAAPLRRDREVVKAALEGDGTTLRFAAAELRTDRDIASTALLQTPQALEHVALRLRADRQLVTQAVERDWSVLRFAAAELRGDIDVVMAAAQQDRRALDLAAAGLRLEEQLQDQPSRERGTNVGEVRFIEDVDEDEDVAEKHGLLQQALALRKRTFQRETSRTDVSEELPESSHITVVANQAGSALLAYTLYQCDPRNGQCLFVHELAVHEDHRNKGLGRELLHWAIRRAKTGEVFAVWLNSLRGRPERFYASLGFVPRLEDKPPGDGTLPMKMTLRDPTLEAQLQPLQLLG